MSKNWHTWFKDDSSEKCLWKIDNDRNYISEQLEKMMESKKISNLWILERKHELLFAKETALKHLLSKIEDASSDVDDLSKLELHVRRVFQESDELMSDILTMVIEDVEKHD